MNEIILWTITSYAYVRVFRDKDCSLSWNYFSFVSTHTGFGHLTSSDQRYIFSGVRLTGYYYLKGRCTCSDYQL